MKLFVASSSIVTSYLTFSENMFKQSIEINRKEVRIFKGGVGFETHSKYDFQVFSVLVRLGHVNLGEKKKKFEKNH